MVAVTPVHMHTVHLSEETPRNNYLCPTATLIPSWNKFSKILLRLRLGDMHDASCPFSNVVLFLDKRASHFFSSVLDVVLDETHQAKQQRSVNLLVFTLPFF